MTDTHEPLSAVEFAKMKSQYESHVDYAREHGFGHTEERNVLRLIAEVERYKKRLFEMGAMEEAPCIFCDYNGPGYFQPDTHPCAALHHAAMGASHD